MGRMPAVTCTAWSVTTYRARCRTRLPCLPTLGEGQAGRRSVIYDHGEAGLFLTLVGRRGRVRATLDRHLIMDNATVEDVSDSWSGQLIVGESAAAMLSTYLPGLSPEAIAGPPRYGYVSATTDAGPVSGSRRLPPFRNPVITCLAAPPPSLRSKSSSSWRGDAAVGGRLSGAAGRGGSA